MKSKFDLILDQLRKNELTDLEYQFKAFSDDQIENFAEALKTNISLLNLNLDANSINGASGKVIAKALNTNNHLISLSLGANEMGDIGAK